MFISLVITIIIASKLGPDVYGRFSYANSIISILLLLSNFGIDSFLLKDLNQFETEKDRNDLLVNSVALKYIISITLFALINIYAFHDTDIELSKIFKILSVQLLFQALLTLRFDLFIKLQSFRYLIISLIVFVLVSVSKILILYYTKSIIYYSIAHVFDILLLGILLLIFRTPRSKNLIEIIKIKKIYCILKKGAPLAISGILILVYTRTDQIMLKALLDVRSVGLYSAALKFSEATFFIPTIFFSSLSTWLYSKDEKFDYKLSLIIGILLMLTFIISVLLTFLSNFLIISLYGNSFLGSIPVLQILSWNCLFVAIGSARTAWIINNNLQKFSPIIVLLGAIVNIVLNLILIPTIGIIGAAIASLFAQIITSVIAPLLFASTRPFIYTFINSFKFVKFSSFKKLFKKLR